MSNNQEETVGYIRNKYGFSKDVAEKYYNRFLQARKNISFVPDVQLNNTYADMVKKEFKLGDANRNVDGFIYADFAKEAVGKAGK